MSISRTKARQRSLKGWETRRRGGKHQKDHRKARANKAYSARITPEAAKIIKDTIKAGVKQKIKNDIKSIPKRIKGAPKKIALNEANKKLRDWSAGQALKYTWVRPNGEEVQIKGFTGTEVRALSPILAHIDARTRDNVHFNAQIDKKLGPMSSRILD